MFFPDINVFFIHVPKAAGSSLEIEMFARDGIEVKAKRLPSYLTAEQKIKYQYDYPKHPSMRYENQHLTAYDAIRTQNKFFLNADFKFSIVRNPWDRFVSEIHWLEQIATPGRKIDPYSLANAYVANARQQYGHVAGTIHHCPQHWHTHDPFTGKQLVNQIFKTEKMQNLKNWFKESYDIDLKMEHKNKSERPDYKDFYTPRLKEILAPVFKKDEEMFCYEF